MKAKQRNYHSSFIGDEVSQNTAALLCQVASSSMMNNTGKFDANVLGSDNLRAINDFAKRKKRHQHSMKNKLDPLVLASNYESKLSR